MGRARVLQLLISNPSPKALPCTLFASKPRFHITLRVLPNMVLKTFSSGPQLRYPITVIKIFKSKGVELAKTDRLVQYKFKFTRTVGDPDLDEEREVEETGYGYWDCPTDGILSQWRVKEGDVVSRDQPFVVIDEPCDHDQQYGGLCVKCGKDMKEANWATVERDTDRAPISMVHDNVALTVSPAEAAQKELDLQKRMLKNRKLSLVVDLDQTIIHACIEPTIGEWQSDPNNPNYEAVKDVRKFQLDDGPRNPLPGAPRRRCWYYIKMRPGLAGFLERISELFELHVYTMGTRTYAQEIAKIVDPDMKLFGNRIISRDENGSMTAKSLQRLFPVSTNMVVVIDDRADVWPRNRSNVIKVTPYDFFKGIGDINSSFLPKRQDIIPTASAPIPTQPLESEATANSDGMDHIDEVAKPEKIATIANSETKILQLQTEEQERAFEKQLTERPLLHMQEELDKAGAEVEGASPSEDVSPSFSASLQNGYPDSPPRHRHNLLRDDDEELVYVEQHLTELHRSFYNQYDARLEAREIFHDVDAITADTVPDAGKVLELLKKRALRGCSIVLSGLLPTNQDVYKSEIGQQLTMFGADLRTRVSDKVTHLVVSSLRPRTQKMQQAARIPSIKIVNQDWVAGSLAQWRKLDEGPFLIEVHPSDRLGASPAGAIPPKLTISTERPGQQVAEDEQKGNGDDDDIGDNTDAEDNPADGEDEDDEVVDTYGVMPTALGDGERSPVDDLKKMDWGKLDDMLAEEFGSDFDSDSDSEFEEGSSETADQSQETDIETESKANNRKRKLNEDEGEEESFGDAGSALSKKQKLAKERTTGLRNVKNVGEEDGEGSGLPTPMGTGDEEEGTVVVEEDDGFDDLEAELEAELAADAAAQGMG